MIRKANSKIDLGGSQSMVGDEKISEAMLALEIKLANERQKFRDFVFAICIAIVIAFDAIIFSFVTHWPGVLIIGMLELLILMIIAYHMRTTGYIVAVTVLLRLLRRPGK